MSRSFDGSGDRLVYTGVVVDTPPFTMATWFKRGAISSTQYLLNTCTQGSTNHSHRLVFSSANLLNASSTDTATSLSSGHTITDTASWHHAAGVWASATSRKCYLDGTADTVNTTSRTPSGIDRFKVGAGGSEGQVFNGLIAHSAVWGVALTADEIASLAAGLSPLLIRPASLVAYWPYLGRDSTEIDIIGRYDLAVTGAAASADEPRLRWPSRKRVIYVPAEASGYTLLAAQGAYSLTGQAAGLLATRLLTAAQGAYAVNGQAATLRYDKTLAAGQGAYSLTGQDAALRLARALLAGQGSYSLSGQAVNLFAARRLTAAQGSYSLTGMAAGLLYSGGSPTLIAGMGSYALTGQDAGLRRAAVLTAAQGSYALTGQAAALVFGKTLAAGQGAYTITGQAAILRTARLLAAETGVYTLTGEPANLFTTGEPVEPQAPQPTGGWAGYFRAEQAAIRRRALGKLAEEADEEREREALAARLEAALIADRSITQAEADRLRLDQLAELYADRALLDRRAQRALAYAERAQTDFAVQLALRELQRQQEDEDLAVLLVLAAD